MFAIVMEFLESWTFYQGADKKNRGITIKFNRFEILDETMGVNPTVKRE